MLAAADSNLLADLDGSDMVEVMIALCSIMTLDMRTIDERDSLRGAMNSWLVSLLILTSSL